jgi:type VI secretion system protein ImpL
MNVFEKLPWMPYAIGGVTLVTLLTIFRGALGLSLLLVVLIVLVIALILAIVFLFRQLKQSQAAEEIEKTISTQADSDIEKSTPGQLAETQALKEDLLSAIETLKKSAKRGGDDALAALPWYMVIGPAGAGKSELIRRSGLNFPLQDASRNPRAVRGVGGTRGFSWWLAHEAVLLDMAGRTLATAAFDDSGDWIAFLETLRKQRPEKPINGAVVVIALDQIADQPESKIDSMARAARERLEELVQHLGVVFPVYVLFNRCDRVAGFIEFFEDLPNEARFEPWGATLSMERARANPAETLFEEEMSVLQASLSERRLPRMAAMPEAVTRARAFAFPLQLERVRPAMRRFLRALFEAEEGADAPMFRGFYFTAAAQEGEPTDRVLQPAVRALNLTVRAPEGFAPPRGGSWFVRDLLAEVVFPDAGLASTSQGARGRLRQRDRLLIGGFGIALAALALMFAGFSCMNGAVVSHARKASVEVSTRVRPDAPIVENLRALDQLRSAATALDSLVVKKPLYRRLGGYSGDVVRDPSVQLWMRRAVETIVGPAARQMEIDLRTLTDNNQGAFLDYYRLFRAWRLLSDPHQITPEDGDLLATQVALTMQGRLSMGSATQTDRNDYPGLVSRQMHFLAGHPEALAAVAREFYPEADGPLSLRAAQRIRGTWDPAAFYRDVIARATPGAKNITFVQLAGQTTQMRGTVEVPGPYTKDGWEKQVKPRVDDYRALVKRDLVLQDVFQQRPPDLATDILNLYAADYSKRWAAFLDGVTLAEPRNMGESAQQLALVAKGDSPMFKLLRGVREQTQLGVGPDTPLGKVQTDWAILKDFFATQGGGAEKVTGFLQRFTQKGGSVDANDRTQSPSAKYQAYLMAAQKKVNEAGQPGAPFAVIRSLMTSGDDVTNPLLALKAFAQQYGGAYVGAAGAQPVARLLAAPIGGAEGAVVGSGINPQLAAAWKSTVLEPFQNTLAGKYPFAASREEASLADFAGCFGPKGYFWTFYAANLAPFLNEDGTPKAANAPVSGGMIAFLKHAYEIRQAFFASGDMPSLQFTISTTPPRFDGPPLNVRWVSFDCGGSRVTYTMGPPREEAVQWPGADPTAGAGIRVNASAAEDPKKKKKKGAEPLAVPVEVRTAEGVWGLFRVLDGATSFSDAAGGADVTWSLPAGASRVHVTWSFKGSSVHHPFSRGFLREARPPANP